MRRRGRALRSLALLRGARCPSRLPCAAIESASRPVRCLRCLRRACLTLGTPQCPAAWRSVSPALAGSRSRIFGGLSPDAFTVSFDFSSHGFALIIGLGRAGVDTLGRASKPAFIALSGRGPNPSLAQTLIAPRFRCWLIPERPDMLFIAVYAVYAISSLDDATLLCKTALNYI